MEVNEHDIGVTLVCPGPVQTDVVANAFTEDVNKVHDTCRRSMKKFIKQISSVSANHNTFFGDFFRHSITSRML